jgi:hypothetical protein
MYLYVFVLITCICMYLYISVCSKLFNTVSLVQIHTDTVSCLSIHTKNIPIYTDTVIHADTYQIQTFSICMYLKMNTRYYKMIKADAEIHFPNTYRYAPAGLLMVG